MYQDEIPALRALVAQLAELLPGWAVDTEHDYDVPRLNGPDGMCIYVRADDKTRYYVGGSAQGTSNLYDHLTYEERNAGYKMSINVAKTKTAQQIAADITRRLLPLLEPINARRIESETNQATATEQRSALITLLEKVLGDACKVSHHTPRSGHDAAAFSCPIKGAGTGSYPRLEVTTNYYGNAAKLVLDDISPDMAAAILALVAAQQKG